MNVIEIQKIGVNGKKIGSTSIDLGYKDIDKNSSFLNQVLNAYLSNNRRSHSNTKTRAEVSGTGKKPYRQKGTGHARFGSLRTPIHTGGGIAFGPKKNKNYTQKISKKLKKKSLAVILFKKNKDNELFHATKPELQKINTKNALFWISKMPLKEGNILILTEKIDELLYKSLRNVPYIKINNVQYVNSLDLILSDNVIFVGNAYKNLFLAKKSNITEKKIVKKEENDQ